MSLTISEAVAMLRNEGLVEEVVGDERGAASTLLRGFAGDRAAGSGQIPWVSPRALASDAARLSQFAGSLLLAPSSAVSSEMIPRASSVIVRSSNPKFAICRLAAVFFPESLQTVWPRHSEGGISADAEVHPTARLAAGVVIAAGVRIGAGSSIGPNSCIAHTDVGEGVSVGANCSIGLTGFGYEKGPDGGWHPFPHVGRVRLESGVRIGSNTCIDRGALDDTIIRSGARIDNLVHVAHNVDVGTDAVVIAHAMLGGSVTIESGAWVAPSVSVKNQLRVGESSVLGLGAVVLRDVPPGVTVVGNPAKILD